MQPKNMNRDCLLGSLLCLDKVRFERKMSTDIQWFKQPKAHDFQRDYFTKQISIIIISYLSVSPAFQKCDLLPSMMEILM